ncbi:DUF262 domain-containing protein [Proteiniclasticum sp.]|uniref:DUF262 domain-containing protein n=1 Tax=Proteiniclasticum sp. TaxID=2053595 RepID=UPI0028A23405|nr:DUF262 domain-containing protein [Proteiniclasticum sp.]
MAENLKLLTINQLLGESFYIADYQRGYRWINQQVVDLLNDIWTFAKMPISRIKENEFYCLQPVVVKRKNWLRDDENITGWEVVDGQQRLTTIHIILNYLTREHINKNSLAEAYGRELFTIQYQTRLGSESFLNNISDDFSNIDYYHISQAYQSVKHWFTDNPVVKDWNDRGLFLSTILGKSDDRRSVQVIWYEANSEINSRELFTRLNIGKIPLTNAELIKALFLSSSSFQHLPSSDREKLKTEISILWDEIELRMSNDDYWSFITNRKQTEYANKIELLFDIIAGKKNRNTDPLHTFLYFSNLIKENPSALKETWDLIRLYDQTLNEWFNNRNLYHKIGYLIAYGKELGGLLTDSLLKRKDEFEDYLNSLIRSHVNFDLEKLNYDPNKAQQNKNIEKVLLLFNIESIGSSQNLTERYPFKYHKELAWSLEHIHAQNSESLDRTKKDLWKKWLIYHETLMQDLVEQTVDSNQSEQLSKLISEIVQLKENEERLTWERFVNLSERIIDRFSENENRSMDEMHGLGNLALLGQSDNSALNNSVFEVKRREIIKFDKHGRYIPICTRRVFLRYYSPTIAQEHSYIWGSDDRKAYFAEIQSVLSNYLPKKEPKEVSQ